MTETELIETLRLRVYDTTEPYFLADASYQSAIRSALAWLNARIKTTYIYAPGVDPSGLELIVPPHDYLLELKAAANVAMMRSAASVTTGAQRRERVEVPNLQVEKEFYDSKSSAWSELADDLLRELEDLLADAVSSEAEVQWHYTFVTDPRTGARSHRNLDTALPATAITATWNATRQQVDLAWGVIASMAFAKNTVQRSATVDFSESRVVACVYDTHETTAKDKPGSGTWYYRVVTTSTNALESTSAVSVVVVP